MISDPCRSIAGTRKSRCRKKAAFGSFFDFGMVDLLEEARLEGGASCVSYDQGLRYLAILLYSVHCMT